MRSRVHPIPNPIRYRWGMAIRCLKCRLPVLDKKRRDDPRKMCACTGDQRREVRVYLGRDPATGAKRYASRTVKGSKAEARRVERKMLEEERPASKGTVGHLLGSWLEVMDRLVRSGHRSPRTVQVYRGYVRKSIAPALGAVPLDELTATHLDDYYAGLEHDLKPATIRQHHAILSAALKQGRKWGWCANVAEDATPPGLGHRVAVAPTPEQVRALLAECERRKLHELAALLFTAATTGARRGELCGLRWSAVDLEAGVVVIDRSVIDMSTAGLQFKGTKTNRARRVALDPATTAVLRRQWERRRSTAEEAGTALPADPYVFSQAVDGSAPYRPNRVTKAFAKLRSDLGLTVTMHSLRHFMATEAIRAGTDIKTVSGRLGHAQASTTLNIYAHLIESADRELAGHMGALVSGE